MSGLVVITRDLMDRSRIQAEVPDAVMVRSVEAPELVDAEVILLDLASRIDPALVVAIGPRVVAYGAHVDTEALDGAITAGCIDALPRSKVFRRVAELLD
jgi:hypothetical protein